jgi:GntR family transcriptional repressor for pyruvate dehydrogenase complex
MPLRPVRRVRLSEHAAEQIIDLIHEQGLGPGSLLPTETALMERMGVGRSSVREALHGLAVLGVVEIRQGQGTFVRSPVPLVGPSAVSGEAVSAALARGLTDELLEAREIIEVRAAGLAARRATPEDLSELERLVGDARAAVAARRAAFQLSAAFHLGVARAAHNDVLESFVASYFPLLAERGASLERLPGYNEWEIREHDEIRRAITEHDARLAMARMRDHLKSMVIHFEHLAAAGLTVVGGRRRRGTIVAPMEARPHG